MRIWIDGKQLDTYESSVSVKKTNNLWKFGNAEFVHTQTISVPATNNNKALLDFADEFRTQSAVARGYASCLFEIDGYYNTGKLYVTKYSKGEFSVIVTCGKELDVLDKKLSDLMDERLNSSLILGNTDNFGIYYVVDKKIDSVQKIAYSTDVVMNNLQQDVLDLLDVSVFRFSEKVVIVTETNPSEAIDNFAFNLNYSRTFGIASTSSTTTNKIVTITTGNINIDKYIYYYGATKLYDQANTNTGLTTPYYGRVPYFLFPFPITIKFPNDDSGDACVICYGKFKSFSGFRMNTQTGEMTGTSLRGKTVTISAGTEFHIMFSYDFQYRYEVDENNVARGYYTHYDAGYYNSAKIVFTLPVFSKDYVEDITLYQFLQTIAAIKGNMLYYNGTKYTITDLSNVKSGNVAARALEVETVYSVEDKPFDFAQNNFVKFKSGGEIVNYTINNSHLTYEKNLYNIPFDGGDIEEEALVMVGDYPAIGISNTGIVNEVYRISIENNTNLEGILSNTRQVKIKFRLSYIDFVSIGELDCIEYKGARLQWVDLTWSDGWCTATLQTV